MEAHFGNGMCFFSGCRSFFILRYYDITILRYYDITILRYYDIVIHKHKKIMRGASHPLRQLLMRPLQKASSSGCFPGVIHPKKRKSMLL